MFTYSGEFYTKEYRPMFVFAWVASFVFATSGHLASLLYWVWSGLGVFGERLEQVQSQVYLDPQGKGRQVKKARAIINDLIEFITEEDGTQALTRTDMMEDLIDMGFQRNGREQQELELLFGEYAMLPSYDIARIHYNSVMARVT